MSQNLVIGGLGSPLLITEGYGRSGATVEVTPGPGDLISDIADRALSLFITQFRRVRDLSAEVRAQVTLAPITTLPDPPEASLEITDMTERALSLFITQFRRVRG